jgi:type VI secretion system protein VasG
MVPVNLKSLVSKLNDTCRRTLEASAGLCLSRSNYDVEVEHWLLKLLETPNTDLAPVLRQYGVDSSRLARDLTKAIDRFKTGNSRPPALSPRLVELMREAWVLSSVEFGAPRVRSGHLLCALLSEESLSRLAREASQELQKLSPEALRKDLPTLTANTEESQGEVADVRAAARSSTS